MQAIDFSEQFKSWLQKRTDSGLGPFVLGFAGGSGSGKTTLAELMRDFVGLENSVIIYQDSYYIDQSHLFDEDGGKVNFDDPASLEFSLLAQHLGLLKLGRTVRMPIYDFSLHKRLERTARLDPKPIIIVDGILILNDVHVREQLDFSVFVQTAEEVRFQRRLDRDVRERGRTPEGVQKQFQKQVKPMHDLYVEPSLGRADLVVNGEDWIVRSFDQVIQKVLNF